VIPPVSPCGQIVDLVRSCYSANVQFYADVPSTTRIVWYFVPPTRPVAPPTIYSSYNWDDGPTFYDPGVVRGTIGQGEKQDNFRPWYNGQAFDQEPGGDHVCGTPAQFLGFLTLGADGQGSLTPAGWPSCCSPQQNDELKLWLNAHDLAQVSGSGVTVWPDRSPEENNATQGQAAFQGVYVENRYGLDKCVLFTGGSWMNIEKIRSTSWTMYSVLQIDPQTMLGALRAAFPVGQSQFAPLQGFAALTPAAPIGIRMSFRNVVLPTRQLGTGETLVIFRVIYDKGVNMLFAYITPSLHPHVEPPYNAGDFEFQYVGGLPNPVGNIRGYDLAELIWYNKVVDPALDTAILKRMSKEWGIVLQ